VSDFVEESVGYKRPPRSNRFRKGQSGNPRGRPRNRRRELPYDSLLGRMVTVREDGRERRVTAAEAFLLQLTKRGLEGDSAATRATLAAIETARTMRSAADAPSIRIVWNAVQPGSVGGAAKDLKIASLVHPYSEDKARLLLAPWIVEAALARSAVELTIEQQRIVFDATRTPERVHWPAWWLVRELDV
jgi:hypothetical protein